jgi:hypothetical protein
MLQGCIQKLLLLGVFLLACDGLQHPLLQGPPRFSKSRTLLHVKGTDSVDTTARSNLQQKLILNSAKTARNAFERARKKNKESGKVKQKRFKLKAKRSSNSIVAVSGDGSEEKSLAAYMSLPLDKYNVLFAKHIERTADGFHLSLPLGAIPNTDQAFDGVNLECDIVVDRNPAQQRNFFRATRLAFAVDPDRKKADSEAAELDKVAVTNLNAQIEQMVNASKADLDAKKSEWKAKADALQASDPGANPEALWGGTVLGAVPGSPNPGGLPGTVNPQDGPPTSDADATASLSASGRSVDTGTFPAAWTNSSERNAEAFMAATNSKEYSQLASRLMTRLLTEASIVVEGQAVVEWGVDKSGKKWPAAGKGQEAGGVSDGVPHKLSFHTEGQVEFTATGALAWFPALVINSLGSKVANQVCPYLSLQCFFTHRAAYLR